jgi:hypothetical protein
MALVSWVVWLVAGLALAVLTLAVSPTEEAPPALPTLGIGALAGLVGGLLTAHLANAILTGPATGLIGSLLLAVVLLAVWGLVRGHQARAGT